MSPLSRYEPHSILMLLMGSKHVQATSYSCIFCLPVLTVLSDSRLDKRRKLWQLQRHWDPDRPKFDLKSTNKITLGSKFGSATLAPQYDITLSFLGDEKRHETESKSSMHLAVKLYKTWISFSRAKDWILLILVTMPSLPNFEDLPMTQYPIFAKVLSSVWLDVPSQSICKENSIWIHLHTAKDDEILSTWCSLLTSQFFKGLLICNLGKTNLQTWIGIWDSVRIGVSLCAVV